MRPRLNTPPTHARAALLGCDENDLRPLLQRALSDIEMLWSQSPFDELCARALAIKEMMLERGIDDPDRAIAEFVAHKAEQRAHLAED